MRRKRTAKAKVRRIKEKRVQVLREQRIIRRRKRKRKRKKPKNKERNVKQKKQIEQRRKKTTKQREKRRQKRGRSTMKKWLKQRRFSRHVAQPPTKFAKAFSLSCQVVNALTNKIGDVRCREERLASVQVP